MDPEVADRLARLPDQDDETARLTPLGYTPLIARLDLLVDNVAELHATVAQLVQLTAKGKAKRSPVKHQPRPRTALDDARVRVEKEGLKAVASVWFSGASTAPDPDAGRWETTQDSIG